MNTIDKAQLCFCLTAIFFITLELLNIDSLMLTIIFSHFVYLVLYLFEYKWECVKCKHTECTTVKNEHSPCGFSYRCVKCKHLEEYPYF